MQVTDDNVAALRAMVTRQKEEYDRLYSGFDDNERTSMLSLLHAAFAEAVDERFKGRTRGDVTAFVDRLDAQVKSRGGELDRRAVERMVLFVMGAEPSIDDLNASQLFQVLTLALTALLMEQNLDDLALDAFLNRAREVANSL